MVLITTAGRPIGRVNMRLIRTVCSQGCFTGIRRGNGANNRMISNSGIAGIGVAIRGAFCPLPARDGGRDRTLETRCEKGFNDSR